MSHSHDIHTAPPTRPRRVVVAGGGIASMELLLALRHLAGNELDVTVIAPDRRFVVRALRVAEPFAAGHSDVGELAALIREQGATLLPTTVASVDADTREVTCADGRVVPYDRLVLAPGARVRAPFSQAVTFGLGDPLALNGILADLEQGYTDTVAFVVPEGVVWSLPLYELALLTADQVRSMGREVSLLFYTPEPGALAVFGPEAGAAVAELFGRAGIELHTGSPVAVAKRQVQLLDSAEIVPAERIVTLPILEGPRLLGVPADTGGFIPVDSYGRVLGLEAVYAVGDATDIAIKQGGIACQQADVVAAGIAHDAGAEVDVEPLRPVLRGRLLTGAVDRFVRRDLQGPHGTQSQEPLWWPPMKVVGRHLGPWLAARRVMPVDQTTAPAPGEGLSVEAPIGPLRNRSASVLGLDPFGPMRD